MQLGRPISDITPEVGCVTAKLTSASTTMLGTWVRVLHLVPYGVPAPDGALDAATVMLIQELVQSGGPSIRGALLVTVQQQTCDIPSEFAAW